MPTPITSFSDLDLNKSYTVADYLNWKFDELVELIKGKFVKMSPSPRSVHQAIRANISFEIKKVSLIRKSKVFNAPFDVYLFGDSDKYNTVVEPDICIICDRTKIKDNGCVGAPDLIVEILSQPTMKKDLNHKFNLYQEAKVKEYWVVYPPENQVSVYVLENQLYIHKGDFLKNNLIPIHIWPNETISCEAIFDDVDFN
ncbi:MAG: Uma2 family endonuclease [Bacteroidota bacterium]|nr:Uma2 family endonuclease [Bacteroidota bacterium]